MAKMRKGENSIDSPEMIAYCLSCPLKKCICNSMGECSRLKRELIEHDGNQNRDSDLYRGGVVSDGRGDTKRQ